MPRAARIVVPHAPHHVTQRGSRRGPVFFCDDDRRLYLQLLKLYADRHGTVILCYCLMDNHIHLILVPHSAEGLARTVSCTHMRYATVINGRNAWTGHLWQERYFSSPLDESYLWTAIRYVERNPVQAGIVKHASEYQWSSARGHCGILTDDVLSQKSSWRDVLAEKKDWDSWLGDEEEPQRIQLLREKTKRDLPCGQDKFLKQLTEVYGDRIIPRKPGRPCLKN